MMVWLSFCDSDKPEDEQFLGVAIVQIYPPFKPMQLPILVEDNWMACAIEKAWTLGINPGGEVALFEIPPQMEPLCRPFLNRLLTREEAENVGKPTSTIH